MRRNSYNGDGHLRPDQKISYLALNGLDNAAPYRAIDPRVSIADFDSRLNLRVDDVPGTPSPSRALCDLFWMNLPWAAIEEEVGEIRIVDVGCGSGRYGVNLLEWSGHRVARYVGIDVAPHQDWARLAADYPQLEFRCGRAEAIDAVIPRGTNVVMSQSTFEHVADDLAAFDRIHLYVHQHGGPVLQMHLVPSQACLWTYLWHGYRQYTPRTLSAITRRFDDCSERALVRLGGRACNALHRRFITWPLFVLRRGDRRELEPEKYRELLRDAIRRDMQRPQPSPAFYALLIHSNPRQSVLASGPWREETHGR